MTGLLTNTTNVTIEHINQIVNFSSPPELFINVNQIIFNGWLFFVLLCVLWFILFIAANKVKDQPLNNAMYAGAITTIGSFLLRGIYIYMDGVKQGLLTDNQLWLFPIGTILLAVIIWSIKE